MHFTNSQAMHESGYLGNTSGSWGKGQIAFGFNLIRVFKQLNCYNFTKSHKFETFLYGIT